MSSSFIIDTSEKSSSFIVSKSPPISIERKNIEIHTDVKFIDIESSVSISSESNEYESDNDIDYSKNSQLSELFFGELEIHDEEKDGGWDVNEYFEV